MLRVSENMHEKYLQLLIYEAAKLPKLNTKGKEIYALFYYTFTHYQYFSHLRCSFCQNKLLCITGIFILSDEQHKCDDAVI